MFRQLQQMYKWCYFLTCEQIELNILLNEKVAYA